MKKTQKQKTELMRFDWYAATVREDVNEILDVLAVGLDAEIKTGKPKQGYAQGNTLTRNGSTVCTVFSGGRNGWPHVYASGDDTDALVPVLRAAWPLTHYVTRMDSAQDFDGPETWDRLYAPTIELADELHLKVNQAGDWHRLEAGRTLYLGAPTSAVRTRLYEKGKQLRGLAPDGGPEISLDLVRLEVQVRPDGEARYTAARSTPAQAYGYANWTQELQRRILDVDVERVMIRERRMSDRERALEYCIQQYGAHMASLGGELGSPEALGVYLMKRHAINLVRKADR